MGKGQFSLSTFFTGGLLCIIVIGLLIDVGLGLSSVTSGYEFTYKAPLASSMRENIQPRDLARCSWEDRGTYFYVESGCLQAGIFPQVSFQEAVDALLPHVVDAEKFYEIDEQQFTYEGTDLIFSQHFLRQRDQRQIDMLNRSLDEADHFIYPKSFLAMYQLPEWTIYASVRDTTMYGECRLTNYNIAMDELDGYLLTPGEELNMNRLIANKPGACRGNGEKFLFYEGACGASTQLFRNALLNPELDVVRRHAHAKRYAGFYGSAVMGDDASMYERSKQLILQNNGDVPIYFKTVDREDGNTVLLSFLPKVSEESTMVIKQQTGKLTSVLTNTIFDPQGHVVEQFERESRYRGIDTSNDLGN